VEKTSAQAHRLDQVAGTILRMRISYWVGAGVEAFD
jgi:hypothetical protein